MKKYKYAEAEKAIDHHNHGNDWIGLNWSNHEGWSPAATYSLDPAYLLLSGEKQGSKRRTLAREARA